MVFAARAGYGSRWFRGTLAGQRLAARGAQTFRADRTRFLKQRKIRRRKTSIKVVQGNITDLNFISRLIADSAIEIGLSSGRD